MTKCTWIGEGEGCELDALAGKNYCEEHLYRVYQQGSAVRRKKDTRTAQAVWDIEQAFTEAVEELIEEGFLE